VINCGSVYSEAQREFSRPSTAFSPVRLPLSTEDTSTERPTEIRPSDAESGVGAGVGVDRGTGVAATIHSGRTARLRMLYVLVTATSNPHSCSVSNVPSSVMSISAQSLFPGPHDHGR